MADTMVRYIDRFLQKHYGELEDYLENIFNSPSTINKLLTHYSIQYDTNHRYIQIVINDTVVKKVELSREEQLEFMKLQLWIEMGLVVHTEPIMFL